MVSERRHPIRSRIFHAVCTEPVPHQLPPDHPEDNREAIQAQDERFFARLPPLDVHGRTVLDYGCGMATTCVFLAQRGARRVLGVDIQSVESARAYLEANHSEVLDRIELRQIVRAQDIGDERFDLVLSKNTFEHVADPAAYVTDMATLLAPNGQLVIGFGSFWRSPYGGHLNFMTKLPWSHLLFPEAVILRERKRYRPGENPRCFEDVRGGLNRMTPARFDAIMSAAGLEPVYYEINRNDRPAARILNSFARLPVLGEYFTFSVHSVWRLRSPASGYG